MVVHRGHVVHKTVGDHSELDCLSTSTHSYCPYKGRHRIIIIIVAGFPRASSRWRCAHAETQLLIRENENGATNSIETPTRSNSDDQMGMDEQFVTGRPSDETSGATTSRATSRAERVHGAPARASAPSRPVPSDDSVSTWQLSGQGCTDGTVQPCCTQFFSVADADKRTSAVLFGRSAMLDGGVVFFLLSGLLFHFPLGRSVLIKHMLSY